MTSYSATVYSYCVLFVIAIFWLAAFKLKRIQQYFTKSLLETMNKEKSLKNRILG